MATKLPVRLRAEPIIDATCEIRFATNRSIVDLLPGVLVSRLGALDGLEKLPAGQVPQGLVIEGLQSQPHLRMQLGGAFISVGPQLVAVTSPIPYPGWSTFKARALEIFRLLNQEKLVSEVDRLSVRYTDLMENSEFSGLDASLILGDQTKFDTVEIKVHRSVDSVRVTNILASPASTSDGRTGLVVDTDVILDSPSNFWEDAPDHLEHLHGVAKREFFSLISEATLAALEPEFA